MNMYQLERNLIDELNDNREYILNETYPEDAITDFVDSAVPIYNSELLKLAANDTALACDEPDIGPAFDGSPTPVNIIAANVYERLSEVAHGWLHDAESEVQ